jgi:teichuronic acid exporter
MLHAVSDQVPALRQKVISGFMWLGSLTFLGQAITWGITLVVVRLLEPKDYGLLAMATVFIGFLTIVNEVGLGPAVIQKAGLNEQDLRNANGWVLVINVALFTAVFFSAPVIAWFFDEPRLVPIIRVLGLNFILISVYFLPQALLVREMNFKTRSIIDLIANLISSAVVLIFALAGFGVWALVLGPFGMHLFKALALNAIKAYRHKPALSRQGMRGMLIFGGYVSVTRVIWYFYSQADILICGKILGKDLLGLYSVSMQLVSIPMAKISPLLSQIGFSAFSRIQSDLNAVQANFLKAVQLVSVISFPLFWGLAIIAPEAIPWLLGAKWIDAVIPIQLLSIVMPIRFIGTVYAPLISGKGRPDVQMWNMVLAIIIMPTAFYIGSRWGIVGLSLAWVIAYPLLFIIMTSRVLSTLNVPAGKFLNAISLPFFASCVMILGVFVFKWQVRVHTAVTVTMSIILGIVIYSLTIYIINRNAIVQLRALFSTKA